MPIGARCAAVFVALAWGVNMIMAKLATAEIPPIMLTALRFVVVAAILLPFVRLKRQQLPWFLALSVTLGTGHFGLLFLGLSLSEVGTGAILVQLGAPVASVLGAVLFKERVSLLGGLGLAAAVAGLALLLYGPDMPPPIPLAILLASATFWAISNILVRMAVGVRPLDMNAMSALFSVPQLAGLSLLLEGNPVNYWGQIGLIGIAGVLYTAVVSSIIAYGMWYGLLQTYGMRVVSYSLLTPVFAAALGIVLMGENASTGKIAGGCLIIGGAFMSMRFPKLKNRASP